VADADLISTVEQEHSLTRRFRTAS
jgi:hypothetical protein